MQLDFGLLTLAYCPLLLGPSFLCSIVSIAVPSKSCQFPNCDLFTSLALLSSFGRETSLVKITGPRSIFTSLFTPTIYFQLLLCSYSTSLCLSLCSFMIYFLTSFPCIRSGLGLNVFHISFLMLSFDSNLIL